MKCFVAFSSLTWYFVEDSLVRRRPTLVRHAHLLHPELRQRGEELLPQGVVEAARAVGARDQYAVGAFLGLWKGKMGFCVISIFLLLFKKCSTYIIILSCYR